MTKRPELIELEGLINARCEGTITAEQAARLEELLVSSTELRRYYILYSHVHACVEWGANQEGNWESDEVLDGKVASDTASSPSPIIPPIILDQPSPLQTSLFALNSPLGSFVFSHLVAVLILGVGLLAGLAWRISTPANNGDLVGQHNNQSQTPDALGPGRQQPLPLLVGHITGESNCQWTKQGAEVRGPGSGISEIQIPKSPNPQIPVFLGDRFLVSSGLMQITYDTGAKVLLEGPCSYTVDSKQSGFLAIGRMTALVEKKEQGGSPRAENTNHSPLSPLPSPLFAVRTPTAVVTDLGTEFGVEVEESGATRSHVFQGSVELRSSNSPRMKTSGEEMEILHAGDSARVERGRNNKVAIARVQGQPGRFVRRIPSSFILHPSSLSKSPSPPTRMSPDEYASYVLSLEPAAYYRMERPKANEDPLVVYDSGPGKHHGLFRSQDKSIASYAPGRFGDAMSFHGDRMNDLTIVSDIPNPPENRMTVAAWVLLYSKPSDLVITSKWGHPRDEKQGIQTFCLNYLWKTPLYRWHHVAYVVDDEAGTTTVRAYVNGQCTHNDPFDPVWLKLSGGFWCIGGMDRHLKLDMHSTQSGLQGYLDEFAVFNKALSAETIERLYLGGVTDVNKNEDFHKKQ